MQRRERPMEICPRSANLFFKWTGSLVLFWWHLLRGVGSSPKIPTSRHHSASEETEENKQIIKNCYFQISKISSRQVTRFEKDKILNIQEFRPGRGAMQLHCGLRLFFKFIYSTYIIVPYYMVCSIQTSFIFLFDKQVTNDPV